MVNIPEKWENASGKCNAVDEACRFFYLDPETYLLLPSYHLQNISLFEFLFGDNNLLFQSVKGQVSNNLPISKSSTVKGCGCFDRKRECYFGLIPK